MGLRAQTRQRRHSVGFHRRGLAGVCAHQGALPQAQPSADTCQDTRASPDTGGALRRGGRELLQRRRRRCHGTRRERSRTRGSFRPDSGLVEPDLLLPSVLLRLVAAEASDSFVCPALGFVGLPSCSSCTCSGEKASHLCINI